MQVLSMRQQRLSLDLLAFFQINRLDLLLRACQAGIIPHLEIINVLGAALFLILLQLRSVFVWSFLCFIKETFLDCLVVFIVQSFALVGYFQRVCGVVIVACDDFVFRAVMACVHLTFHIVFAASKVQAHIRVEVLSSRGHVQRAHIREHAVRCTRRH